MDPDLRRRVLAAALGARHEEVLRKLGSDPVPRPPVPEPASDPEETLRYVMVQLWPRVAQQQATASEERDLLSKLSSIASAARSDDLRFLDAWNNAYEALALEPRRTRDLNEFLRAYADILAHHLGRVER